MRAKHVLPALLLPVLLGCSANAGGIDVDGETFSGTEVQGHELAPDTQISLTFSGEQISANAGCNTLFGQGTWEGSELHVQELASTEMGCDSALHDQDEWLAGFLQSTPVASLEELRSRSPAAMTPSPSPGRKMPSWRGPVGAWTDWNETTRSPPSHRAWRRR